MKMIFGTALVAIALTAAPVAAAGFTGIRGEVTVGLDDAINAPDVTDVTYGATVGVDISPLSNVIVGVEANLDNVFDRRNIGASARVGYVVRPDWLVYAKGGYTNYRDVTSQNLDGFRVGGGVEHNISARSFVRAEYRYSDFQGDTGAHGAVLGLGIRF
jgi:outer membrane immunogenic protein